jgi:hypothetical protein
MEASIRCSNIKIISYVCLSSKAHVKFMMEFNNFCNEKEREFIYPQLHKSIIMTKFLQIAKTMNHLNNVSIPTKLSKHFLSIQHNLIYELLRIKSL